MNLSRKITSITLAALLFLSAASGCGNSNAGAPVSSAPSAASNTVNSSEPQKATIKLATLKGPAGLGLLKLMNDNDTNTSANKYEFTLTGAPDEIVTKMATGEIDVATVPPNLAATLYNKTNGKVQMAAVYTLGVLSIVTNGENITSIKDLKGKTVYSSGQGSIPEYAINYILEKNGLEVGKDVKIEYKAEHAELAALVVSGKAKIAVLPEPFVTQVTGKNKDVKIALDVTKEWNKVVDNKSILTMGCLIVRKDFIEKNKDAFNKFLEEYKASTDFTNSSIEQAAALSEKYGIMPAAVAKKAIPNCNIVYIDGSEMKAKIPDFLNVLFKANPKSVGGKLPGDDFYYEK